MMVHRRHALEVHTLSHVSAGSQLSLSLSLSSLSRPDFILPQEALDKRLSASLRRSQGQRARRLLAARVCTSSECALKRETTFSINLGAPQAFDLDPFLLPGLFPADPVIIRLVP